VENEDYERPVADSSRMTISMSNDSHKVYKDMLKEEFKNELIEILMKELQEKLKENIQKQLKEYQDNTKKKLEKAQ
jgi:predicted nuclease with TOPRIM domain